MNVLNFLVDNWSIVVAGLAVIAGIVGAVIKFAVLPSSEQIASLKEWLRWAVTCAEKELGSGTGQLKLRAVYDMAVERFPWVAKFIGFEKFAEMVDEALEWMRTQLENNNNIKSFVDAGPDSNEYVIELNKDIVDAE